MSAETLKTALQDYANEHFPGWQCAGTVIRTGEGKRIVVEELVITPAESPASSPALVSSSGS
jgi:hypothetical protein